MVIQTSDHERFHGVLETLSPNADIILTVSHRLDNNNNDIITSPTLPIDLLDTVDSSAQAFDLRKRIIKAANIVEIIAVDIDLSGNAKCTWETVLPLHPVVLISQVRWTRLPKSATTKTTGSAVWNISTAAMKSIRTRWKNSISATMAR